VGVPAISIEGSFRLSYTSCWLIDVFELTDDDAHVPCGRERESRKGAQLAAGPLALGPARARMGGRGRLSLQSELGCGVSFWETEGPAGLLLRSGQKEKERKRV